MSGVNFTKPVHRRSFGVESNETEYRLSPVRRGTGARGVNTVYSCVYTPLRVLPGGCAPCGAGDSRKLYVRNLQFAQFRLRPDVRQEG